MIAKRMKQILTIIAAGLMLAGCSPDEPVQPEHVAAVLNREALADCWLVNQVDALPDPEKARALCELINRDASPCSLGR